MRHWPELLENPDGHTLIRLLPTYDESLEEGFEEARLVPVYFDYEMGGLRVALLSRRNPDGTVNLDDSPEVYIERHPSEWLLLIVREGAGDEDLMVRIPDTGEPILAEQCRTECCWKSRWGRTIAN